MDLKSYSSLYEKYDIPGPRYTSYPTVPAWKGAPTPEKWEEGCRSVIAQDLALSVPQGISVYAHIPFCRSLCTYCGCFQKITRDTSEGTRYVDLLIQEWNHNAERLGQGAKLHLAEVHLGGGTPTFLLPQDLDRMLTGIFAGGQFLSGGELSLEVDPRTTHPEHLEVSARHGGRRISLGVQDFDPEVQKRVHRVQSFDQVRDVTVRARELGFTSVNFDLIYGLPRQKLESIERTIEQVLQLRPDRMAFYSYAHVPWMRPAQKAFSESEIPVGQAKRELYLRGRELLLQAGYQEIGMDHFALPSDSLAQALNKGYLHRNFMGYTHRPTNLLLGLGLSSISDSGLAFAQNTKSFADYEAAIVAKKFPIEKGHELSLQDQILRRHILDLMTRFSTNLENSFSQVEFLSGIRDRLKGLESDGLVEWQGHQLLIPPVGRPFLRNACMAFDAYLSEPGEKRFSRTI